MTRTLLRGVELGNQQTDIRIAGDRIAEIGRSLRSFGSEEAIDAHGGAVLPGLWDHHIHLLALAAREGSVSVGPPHVTDAGGFGRTLRAAASERPAGAWIRAVGHQQSVGGDPDRDDLDGLVPHHPLRVQHRSGAMWILNSTAIDLLDVGDEAPPGVERSAGGRPTGRIFGLDRWLRERLPAQPPPDLTPVGRHLAARGVVGVTDATPYEQVSDLSPLADAAQNGSIPQLLVAMGGPALRTTPFPPGLQRGPVKLILADHALPELDRVAAWITDAHNVGRPVAIHCVTRAALVLALAAWEVAGASSGDRVEHGAVVPPELRDLIGRHRLTVVTQPNFVAERGDVYLSEVDDADLPHLYPCGSLLDAGIRVGGSTDAPFGDPDPWRAIAAAVDRRSESGRPVGLDERIPAARAVDLFLSGADDPGGPPRRVEVGAPSHLCVLDRGFRDALADPASVSVTTTIIGGGIVHHAG